ncbi:MAG TPA: mechanosensitive ion channel family protein [Nitrolancea sp.]|nr:mechanosensitive ion channel family protein [Nitrolancea sp.]
MQSVVDALDHAGTETVDNVGALARQIPTFLIAIIVVIFFVWLSQWVTRILRRGERFSPKLDPSLKLLIEQLITVFIIIFGVAVAFGIVGVSFATILATFGVAGLIVGFALKDILENFVAGVLILWRRPYEIADQIQVGTNAGTVSEINFRTTTLRTADGIQVFIPNAQIFNQPIQNLTEYGTRRTTIVLQFPLDTDLGRAEGLLRQAVTTVDGVLSSAQPEILLLGSTTSAYELHVRYWTAPEIQVTNRIESAVRRAIDAALTGVDLSRTPATPAGTPNASETSH